ncbi:MAG TPA: flagellar assembly protein FliW [Solirubrobacteraceae bacterium]|jgi:flagellar assembly factor FliW
MPTQTITLESTRFGSVEIPPEAVVDFPTGLIGLGGRRYAILARDEDATFVWLHSLEDPDLALPLTNPWRFFANFEVELADDEAERIGVDEAEETAVYVTVRAAESLEDFSANLRAPILIAHGSGHQVINQAPDAPVRAPLFANTSEVAA